MKVIFFEKEMILLRNKDHKSYINLKNCHICKETFEDKYLDNKKYFRVQDHCHTTS